MLAKAFHRRARGDAEEIKNMLREVLQNQRTIMSKIDDLDAEVDSVVTTMTKAGAAIAEIQQELTDAQTNDDDDAITAAIAKLEPVRAALDTSSSAVSAPTVAPIPGVNTGSVADIPPATPSEGDTGS